MRPMNLLCLLSSHNWEQLTDWLPVEMHRDFRDWVEPMALGRCRRCLHTEPRPVFGSHTWGYGTDKHEMSMEAALEHWRPQLERRNLFDDVMRRLAR